MKLAAGSERSMAGEDGGHSEVFSASGRGGSPEYSANFMGPSSPALSREMPQDGIIQAQNRLLLAKNSEMRHRVEFLMLQGHSSQEATKIVTQQAIDNEIIVLRRARDCSEPAHLFAHPRRSLLPRPVEEASAPYGDDRAAKRHQTTALHGGVPPASTGESGQGAGKAADPGDADKRVRCGAVNQADVHECSIAKTPGARGRIVTKGVRLLSPCVRDLTGGRVYDPWRCNIVCVCVCVCVFVCVCVCVLHTHTHTHRYAGVRCFPDSRGPRDLDPTPPPCSGGDQDQFYSTAYFFDPKMFAGNAYRCVRVNVNVGKCVCVCVCVNDCV